MTSYINQSSPTGANKTTTGGATTSGPAVGKKDDESKHEEPIPKQQHHYPTARESLVPSVQLPHGTRMPLLGMGLWQVPREITAQLVYDAIKECGVRHLDLAAAYGNEKEVGEGIKRVISEGIVTRSELFICSKLWNTYHRHGEFSIFCIFEFSKLSTSEKPEINKTNQIINCSKRGNGTNIKRFTVDLCRSLLGPLSNCPSIRSIP